MRLSTGNLIDDLYRWNKEYFRNIKALSYSNNTIDLYSRAINMYIEYMHEYQDDISIKDIKGRHLTGFLGWLEDEAKKSGKPIKNGNYLSKGTKETYLKAVKGLFVFIGDNNDDLFTFDRYFKNIKIASDSKPEEKIDYLTSAEVSHLISVIERQKSKVGDYNAYRDSFLVRLMLFAGLRISETLGVRLCDINRSSDNTYAIRVYAKGGKEQTSQIDSSKIEDELEYFKKVASLKPDEFIMRTRSGKRLIRQGAFQIVNNLYRHAGIKHEGLHLLRHTFAMWMTLRGVNVIDIKDAMRHSNINTTMVYAKATKQSVINAVVG